MQTASDGAELPNSNHQAVTTSSEINCPNNASFLGKKRGEEEGKPVCPVEVACFSSH